MTNQELDLYLSLIRETVYGICIRVHRLAIADDLYHDIIIYFLGLNKWIDKPGWIITVTKNKCYDYLRGKRYNYSYLSKFPHVSLDILVEFPDSLPDTYYVYQNHSDIELEELLQSKRLTDKERVAIRYYLEGYTQCEISELDPDSTVSRSMISKRLSKAHGKMRKRAGL